MKKMLFFTVLLGAGMVSYASEVPSNTVNDTLGEMAQLVEGYAQLAHTLDFRNITLDTRRHVLKQLGLLRSKLKSALAITDLLYQQQEGLLHWQESGVDFGNR